MKRMIMVSSMLVMILMTAFNTDSMARGWHGRGCGPRYYAPRPVCAPRPVYYAPRPAYYAPPPPVYYAPRPRVVVTYDNGYGYRQPRPYYSNRGYYNNRGYGHYNHHRGHDNRYAYNNYRR